MVAVTRVVIVSLRWLMQWTKKRLLFVFSANSLQSNLRFGLPNSSQFSCQFHNLGFWIRNPRSEIQKGSETNVLTWWTSCTIQNMRSWMLNTLTGGRGCGLWNSKTFIRLLSRPVLTEWPAWQATNWAGSDPKTILKLRYIWNIKTYSLHLYDSLFVIKTFWAILISDKSSVGRKQSAI